MLKECVHLNWKDVTIQIKSINSLWSYICQSKIVANLTYFSSRVVFLHIYINVKGCVLYPKIALIEKKLSNYICVFSVINVKNCIISS